MKISSNPFSEENEDYHTPHLYMIAAVAALFILLLLRLWFLQIIRGHEYRVRSENNRTRVQDILPARGLITDRNGEILVDNYPSYQLRIMREDVADEAALTSRLAYYLNRPIEEVQERYEAVKDKPAFKPALLYADLSREQLVALETHRFELPGAVIKVKPSRRYRHEMLASHVIGYLNEVSKSQLEQPVYADHRVGDLAGQFGVEKQYEAFLHGKRGWRLVEVNAAGRVLNVIDSQAPTPGDSLQLTIDRKLQQAAQDALGEDAGAIVALNPQNGEVLAMASMPTFNQSDFVHGISPKKWKELVKAPRHPLENRAVAGQYPPGSTYKIIAAAAALELEAIDLRTRIPCYGRYPLGDRVFHCWSRGHGRTNLHRSLVESCDIYYYDVSLTVGVDNLARYARAFGLGEKTHIGLSSEKPGLTPTKAWKKKRYGRGWQKGETLSVVIGQGYNLATPLQMAVTYAAAVNGGRVYRPQLVKKITDPEGRIIKSFFPHLVRTLTFRPETLEAIKKALIGVVNERRGTGKAAKMEDVVVGGKTGTSQVVTLEKFKQYKEEELPYKYRDHAWFVCFAPAEKPQIVISVVMEHVGHGGALAAPAAKKVLEAFFEREEEILPSDLTSTEKETEKGEGL